MTEPLTQSDIRNLRRHIADYDTDPRRIGMLADGDKHDAFRDERRWLATLDRRDARIESLTKELAHDKAAYEEVVELQAKELAQLQASYDALSKDFDDLDECYDKRTAELAEARAERDWIMAARVMELSYVADNTPGNDDVQPWARNRARANLTAERARSLSEQAGRDALRVEKG